MRHIREELAFRAVGAIKLRGELLELGGTLGKAASLAPLSSEPPKNRRYGDDDDNPDYNRRHREAAKHKSAPSIDARITIP
jgi:hypothetical protein